jgi:hypothetical protein
VLGLRTTQMNLLMIKYVTQIVTPMSIRLRCNGVYGR